MLTFTNSGVSKSIQGISTEIAQHLADDILERFQALADESQRMVESESSVYWDMESSSFENKQRMALMFTVVRLNPDITSIYIGLANGNFINVINQAKTSVRTYQYDPKNCYLLILLTRSSNTISTPAKNAWYYLNSAYEVIASEFPGKKHLRSQGAIVVYRRGKKSGPILVGILYFSYW